MKHYSKSTINSFSYKFSSGHKNILCLSADVVNMVGGTGPITGYMPGVCDSARQSHTRH